LVDIDVVRGRKVVDEGSDIEADLLDSRAERGCFETEVVDGRI